MEKRPAVMLAAALVYSTAVVLVSPVAEPFAATLPAGVFLIAAMLVGPPLFFLLDGLPAWPAVAV